jgi:hypothetical protein
MRERSGENAMTSRTLSIVGCTMLAGLMSRGALADTIVVDVSQLDSMDGLDDPSNVTLQLDIGPHALVTGLVWDVNLETVGLSWASEAQIALDNSDLSQGVFLRPGIGDDHPTEGVVNYADGADLTDIDGLGTDISFAVHEDGILVVQLFESYDDMPDAIDAHWRQNSTIVVEFQGEQAQPADLNGDGVVDVLDLIMLLLGWGTPSGDINGDGTTDVLDLIEVILAWSF